MDNTKRKGAVSVTITYICWGLLTVFWNLLAEVNSAYVLAQRVVWSMLFMLGYLAVTGRWGDIRQVFADKKDHDLLYGQRCFSMCQLGCIHFRYQFRACTGCQSGIFPGTYFCNSHRRIFIS